MFPFWVIYAEHLMCLLPVHFAHGVCTINLIKCEKLNFLFSISLVTLNSHWIFPGSNEIKRKFARIACPWQWMAMDVANGCGRVPAWFCACTLLMPHFIFAINASTCDSFHEFYARTNRTVSHYPTHVWTVNTNRREDTEENPNSKCGDATVDRTKLENLVFK